MYHHIRSLISLMDFQTIPENRKETLRHLSSLIESSLQVDKAASLNFICTHNSRRSQMAQVWAALAAHHYGHQVHSFSGGTEVTGVAPQVLKAFDHFGFEVESGSGKNAKHVLSFNSKGSSIALQSKKYNAAANPKDNFIAVMTCSDADNNCPIVNGCKSRISLTYTDPKYFDGSLLETAMYEFENFKIATEIFFAFSEIKA